ncbi:MAG: NAD(P)(+) transhydrogenase (Re/Si-specific) subunit alpha, partial [Candidatus Dormibacteria bacterium]
MRIVVPRESAPGELRVAVVPDSIPRLQGLGAEVAVEKGAGAAAFFPQADYSQAGALTVSTHRQALSGADLLLKVRAPLERGEGVAEVVALRRGSVLVGLLEARERPELLAQLAQRGITAFSLELLPRISRAQDMDVLSAMSTVSGYYAVLLGASRLAKLFPLMMTAAGTITPARVLVLGAGVAGLQAIATARRLGAVVRAFDVRPAVKEQVESLGAGFVELEQEVEH